MSSNPNPKSPSQADKLKPNTDRDPNPEVMLWSGTFSAKSMIGTWIVLVLLTIGAVVAIVLIPTLRNNLTVRNVLLIVWAVAWLVALGLVGYQKLAHFYELSNQRLKHRDGILIRQNNRVEVIDIDDVSFKQGIIETMFNVGNIHIRSSDTSHPNLVLRGVSDVKRVADLIDNARRTERTKRGLYVESI